MVNREKLDEALCYKKNGGLNSPQTRKVYRHIADHLLTLVTGTPIVCASRSKYTQVKAVIKRLYAYHVIDADHAFAVVADIQPAASDPTAKTLTQEQFFLLLEYLPTTKKGDELRLAVKLAYYAGLRRNQILSLRPDKIALVWQGGKEYLRIKDDYDRDRKIFLPQAILDEMQRFAGFSINSNYATHTIRKAVALIRQKTPTFPDADFHSLRHSYAMRQLFAGADAQDVQAQLGNTSQAAIRNYKKAMQEGPRYGDL